MYFKTSYSSPIGMITLACEGDNLVGLWMEEQKYFGGTVDEEMVEASELPILEATKKWLDRYFNGEKPEISELSLAPIGGEFRQAVWKILCEIPYGETTTYGAIAKEIAKKFGKEKMAAQAVGGAVGHNPISIIIPCHRVVGTNGGLVGYGGGLDIKVKLLTLEGVPMENFTSDVFFNR